MGLLLIIVLLLGGSATLASDNSLPGDILYPLKISVNEGIRGAVAVGAKAQGNWDVLRTERRLGEALELAEENNLSVAARTEIEERFEEASEQVKISIKALQESDPATAEELANRFKTSLQVNAQLFKNFHASTTGAVQVGTLIRREENATSALQVKSDVIAEGALLPY